LTSHKNRSRRRWTDERLNATGLIVIPNTFSVRRSRCPTRKNVSPVACAISLPPFRQMIEEKGMDPVLSDDRANGEARAIQT
jgi:hypothetical protein